MARAVPAAAVPAAARKRMTFVGFLLNFVDTMMKHLKLSKQCFHSWWTYHVIAFNEWMTCNRRILPRRQLLVPVVSWMPFGQQAVDYLGSWSPPSVFSSLSSGAVFSNEESVHRLGRFMARAGCQLSLGDGV